MENDSNTPDSGTEVVQPEQSDTIPDYVFWDPDTDQDTPEPAEPEMIEDDGTDDEEVETEEVEAEEADEEDDDTSPAETIELPDGTRIDRDEVVKGYLRQSDYTRKTSEVADMRKTLEAETTRISGITEAFIDYLSKQIPAPPDQALAYRDPNAYTRQKAAHEAAVQQVQKLVQMGEQAKETTQKLSETDRRKKVAEENARLSEKFPEVANPKGREAFFSAAADAAEAVGFSMDELQGVDDHRMFMLAHYAKIGMEAQQSKQKAQAKAKKAAPSAPNKPSTNKRQHAARNREAMKKLAQTGSIRDALKVEWE